jgi:hypothetical protein
VLPLAHSCICAASLGCLPARSPDGVTVATGLAGNGPPRTLRTARGILLPHGPARLRCTAKAHPVWHQCAVLLSWICWGPRARTSPGR